jgi:serine/threonine protein kinase
VLICKNLIWSAGHSVSPHCTISYAAPEVLSAYTRRARVVVHPAQDIWALGVMAYETITRERAFPAYGSSETIMACGRAAQPYPWERPEAEQARLSFF